MLLIMKHAMVAVTLGTALLVALPGTAVAGPLDRGEEPVEARTETSTTAVGPDGVRTFTLHTGPVQLRRGTGWLPVDLTLAPGADGVVRPVAAPHDLALTPTGPVVHYAAGGSDALDWNTPLPAPQLAGHRAVYPQARPGHDLVVEATRAGFVASLRRSGPGAPVPPLALREAAPTAPAEPAAGAPLVETTSAVSRVVAAAPPTSAAPVPFDTTVQTTVLRTDTSGEPDLRLGSYDGTAVARSYLTWDLAGLAGAPVGTASLHLHQDWSSSCDERAWEVWSSPAAGPATRWAGQPVADRMWASSTATLGHGAACAPGWTAIDVTDLVRSWAAGGAPSGTVQLRASDEADPLSWKRFGSAESPNAPRLEIRLS
jgi:hypothetical protein